MEEKALVPSSTHEFDFYGDLLTVAVVDNTAYVALRPITDFLGLTWGSQYNRVQRDDVLAQEVRTIKATGADGKQYEMICLPLQFLPGYLFGVDTSRVKTELKEKLTRYKRECFMILWQAFQSRALTPVEPDVIPQLDTRVGNLEQDMKAVKVILSEIRGLSSAHRATAQKMVNEMSRISGVKHLHIWSDLKDTFHVASYTDIPDEKWPEVQKWLQQRLNTARLGKGIEQQPSLFSEEQE